MTCLATIHPSRHIDLPGQTIGAYGSIPVYPCNDPTRISKHSVGVECRISTTSGVVGKGVLVQEAIGCVVQAAGVWNSETGFVSLDRTDPNNPKLTIRNYTDTSVTVVLDILGYLL